MKILLTAHQFVPEYNSGTEILTFHVAKKIISLGHKVFVLTGYPAQSDMPDELRFDEYDIEGVHVFRYHHSYSPTKYQSVVTEIEYNNALASGYFLHILEQIQPDVVHFFHLSRLGAGLIDAVVQQKIPGYYTPTDFWSVCPTSQMLLAGGRLCSGPSPSGGNCVKHVAALTRGRAMERITKYIPDWFADFAVRLTTRSLLPNYPFCHDVVAMGRRKSFIVSRINGLHGIISPSAIMTKTLIENGVDKSVIQQSAFGIETSSYGQYDRARRSSSPLVVGFIGTLASHKGCHVLLDAFKDLPSRALLKIYGSPTDFPDYYARLQEQAKNITRIEFCGTFPNSNIAEVLSGIDVLVVPSLWYENTPLVIYSALGAKCPVIVSDFPGMSEVIREDKNGLVFQPGNSLSLRDCLRRLLTEKGLIEKLSAGCHPPKSIDTYAAELLEFYSSTYSKTPKQIPDLQAVTPCCPGLSYPRIVG
jgi:glycosyltransferase involved in cell wall biosynthesis